MVSLRSAAGWRLWSGKNSSNIPLKPQPYSSMGRAADLHSGGRRFESSWWTDFFWKINTFAYTFFLNSALITLLLGITSTHRNGTWAKLNARHLGTRICWLLIDSCFGSFITARWRLWCRGKTGNSCHFLWYIPVKTT